MNFKLWLENWEEDHGFWPEDELMDHISQANASIKPNPNPPTDLKADPDDLFNSGGIFTFIYVNNKLFIAPPGVAHRFLAQKNPEGQARNAEYGRYGIESGYPVVTFWNKPSKEAIRALFDKKLIHPSTYLTQSTDRTMLAADFLKPKMPASKKKELEVVVQIGNKDYPIYDLPRLLHVLPSNNQEHKAISAFICQNHDKYPVLKNFLVKAKCVKFSSPADQTPGFLRRREYWPTSESTERA